MSILNRSLLWMSAFSVVTGAVGLAAAAPRTHDGFYLDLEAGVGYLSSSADDGVNEIGYSGATYGSALFLGGTIGPVVIGGGLTYDNAFSPSAEIGGNEYELDGLELHLIGFGAFVDVYPDPTEGLHFMGMLGWGGLEASLDGDVSGSDPTGMLLGVGGGYDFWVADEWSIGPLARLIYAPLSMDDVDYGTTQFTVAASFKYH